MSKSTVSRLCAGLDDQVRAFRERPLDGRYPYLWLDAKVERVREPGGVRHKCLVIAYAVHESGRREVIGLDVGEAETEAFWREGRAPIFGGDSEPALTRLGRSATASPRVDSWQGHIDEETTIADTGRLGAARRPAGVLSCL